MELAEEVLKLLLAMLVGGLIGAEREFRDKSAGFRTILLITVGSTLFTIFSLGIGNEINPTRIAANIVTGIGFLGAGTILREGHRVTGLTTAATIWLAAALGMGIGAGRYALVFIATGLTLLVLGVFPSFERWLGRTRETVTYEVSLPIGSPKRRTLRETLHSHGLQVYHEREIKIGDQALVTLRATGRPENHQRALESLFEDPDIIEVKY